MKQTRWVIRIYRSYPNNSVLIIISDNIGWHLQIAAPFFRRDLDGDFGGDVESFTRSLREGVVSRESTLFSGELSVLEAFPFLLLGTEGEVSLAAVESASWSPAEPESGIEGSFCDENAKCSCSTDHRSQITIEVILSELSLKALKISKQMNK